MESDLQELIETTQESQEVLFRAETVFPITPFPDTIAIDKEKLSVSFRSFFRVAKIYLTKYSDIVSVESMVGPFLGSLHITRRFYSEEPIVIKHLQRGDAIKLQKMLQGFIIATEKGIDYKKIDKETLLSMMLKLGEGVVE